MKGQSRATKAVRIISEGVAKQSVLQKATSQVYSEDSSGRKWVAPPVNFAELKALYDPYHKRCAALKAMCAVGLGWEDQAGNDIPLPGNMQGDTAQDVLNQCSSDLEDTGNAYIELVRNRRGKIGEMFWLPSAQMLIGKDRELVQQDAGSRKKREWPLWNGQWPDGSDRCVLHVKREGTWSSFYGEPDWLGCIDSIMLAGSIRLYLRKTFDNNCMPSFMVTLIGAGLDDTPKTNDDGEQLPSELDEFMDMMEANFRGARNAGKTWIQEVQSKDGKVDIQRLSSDFTEMRNLKPMLDTSRDEIVSCHGVPPRLAGVVVSGALGGSGEVLGQMQLFDSTIVANTHRIWQEALNPVLPEFEGVTAKEIVFRGLDLEQFEPAPFAVAPAQQDAAVQRTLAKINRRLAEARRGAR